MALTSGDESAHDLTPLARRMVGTKWRVARKRAYRQWPVVSEAEGESWQCQKSAERSQFNLAINRLAPRS